MWRSYRYLKVFSGLRRSLLPSTTSLHEFINPHSLIPTVIFDHSPAIRCFASQMPLEAVGVRQARSPNLDVSLQRIDREIRRVGRISRNDVEKLFEEFQTLKNATSRQSLLLIHCCGSLVPQEKPHERTQLSLKIWEKFVELEIPLDISHYNALLRVYLENEHEFTPMEFLATLEKNGIEPNRVTYQRLLARYCQVGDIEGATEILQVMKGKSMPVNENVFNSLVMGHSRANDMESAAGVLEVMQSAGLEPSPDTYMTLLVGYAEHGDMEGISRVLSECEEVDAVPLDRDLMEVIYALAVKGFGQHVPQIVDRLQKTQGYAQDCINLIFRLVNAGKDEVAYRILDTMPPSQNAGGETLPSGTFFLKHLVDCDMPVTKILHYCHELKRSGDNVFSFERTMAFAARNGRPELMLALARVMREEGADLRPHYFWPALCHYAKRGEEERIYEVVKEMATLEVPLTLETCRDYVIPPLIGKATEDQIISTLTNCGRNTSSWVNAIIAYHLSKHDLSSAASLLSRYAIRVTSAMRQELAEAYCVKGEASHLATILGQMVSQDSDMETDDGSQARDPNMRQQNVAGFLVLDVIRMLRGKASYLENVEKLLEAMEKRGISLSGSSSLAIKNSLGEQLSDTIEAQLERLTSGDLILQPLEREYPIFGHERIQNVADMEKRIADLESQENPSKEGLLILLINYARNKEVEKAEEVKKKLDADNHPLAVGIYALMIDMYVDAGKLPEAKAMFAEFNSKEDGKLSPLKTLKLAQLMVVEGEMEEAVKVIQGIDEEVTLTNLLYSILNTPASKGDVAGTQRIMEVLLEKGLVSASSAILGTPIKAYLANNDLEGAIEAFEKLVSEHKLAPHLPLLMQACIKREDTDKLQKIVDLGVTIHGEMNNLYDLAFAFVECGKIRQAKKIIETPGLRALYKKLDYRCNFYLDTGMTAELEHVVAITRDIYGIDRNRMYMFLLQAYKRQNDCEKALEIWTSMQEENVEPSEEFLLYLGRFLKANGKSVPFALPGNVSSENRVTVQGKPKQIEKSANEADQNSSILLDGLLKENRLEEAKATTLDMLMKGAQPNKNVFIKLVSNLAAAGDVETLANYENYINEDTKAMLRYNNRICEAYVASGRTEEYLDWLDKKIDSTSDADLDKSLPKLALSNMLEMPNTLSQVKSLAEKCAARGATSAMNCVWMHLFKEGLHSEAQEIYGTYLSNAEKLEFRNILRKAVETENADLLTRLVQILDSRTTATPQTKGFVYSNLLRILGSTNRFEEGLSVLETALKNISLSDITASSLEKIKIGLENDNKIFPYTIPLVSSRGRRFKKDSSDSDSD